MGYRWVNCYISINRHREKTEFTLILSGWKKPNEMIGKARDKMDDCWTGMVNPSHGGSRVRYFIPHTV
jgi:hypothetical protein